MDFDWHVMGTVLGGGATALLTRFLGITQRMSALERRLDVQTEHIATLMAQNQALVAKDTEQEKLIRELTSDKVKLAGRVGELERALEASEGRAKQLAQELYDSLAQAQPSHRTLPPPGGKPR